MKRSQRMQPVRRLKRQEERRQAKKFAEAQHALEKEMSQLQMLQKYQSDYLNGLSGGQQNNNGLLVSASQLEKYQQFLSGLSKAVENQRQMIDLKEQAVEVARRGWTQANAQLNAMDNLIEKIKQEEAQQVSKQEQRFMDDFPLRNNRY